MNETRRREYLAAMGIPLWERRAHGAAPVTHSSDAASTRDRAVIDMPVEVSAPSPIDTPRPIVVADADWQSLTQAVHGCTACELHRTRKQAVFGVGNRTAQWLFVGEAPGAEEDRQGEPFVGPAGQLLNAMLFAIGLKREEIYIANVLKCRPPNNRDPQGQEVERCEPYLLRQIDLIQPRIIIALGRFAAHSLLKTEVALSKLRGQRLSYHDIPLIVTYHPAYLLRNPIDKRRAWDDLCLARTLVSG